MKKKWIINSEKGLNMDIKFLNIKDFAERIKVHPQTVRRAIKNGDIYAFKLTGKRSHYKIAESELERIHLKGLCEKQK